MPDIFNSPSSDPVTFVEMTAAQLIAMSGGYFGLMCAPVRITEYAIKNTLDAEIEIYLQNHEDKTQTKRFWMKLGANESFAMQSHMAPQIYIKAGTWIWIKAAAADPTSGKVSLFYWGS